MTESSPLAWLWCISHRPSSAVTATQTASSATASGRIAAGSSGPAARGRRRPAWLRIVVGTQPSYGRHPGQLRKRLTRSGKPEARNEPGGQAAGPLLREDGRMLDHLSIQCADVAASAAFYDSVLAPLGGRRVMDFGEVIGFGTDGQPDFWIGPQATGGGFRESHIAFAAPVRAAVQAFFDAAVAASAAVLHEPRAWPEYHPGYYAAFVRDPDGNNVEAVCHAPG